MFGFALAGDPTSFHSKEDTGFHVCLTLSMSFNAPNMFLVHHSRDPLLSEHLRWIRLSLESPVLGVEQTHDSMSSSHDLDSF